MIYFKHKIHIVEHTWIPVRTHYSHVMADYLRRLSIDMHSRIVYVTCKYAMVVSVWQTEEFQPR
jgi:hypothetical protein